MRLTSSFLAPLPLLGVLSSPLSETGASDELVEFDKRAISTSVYNDLVFYLKYASTAYGTTSSVTCPRPNGNVFITNLYGALTDTQGFVARDDTRKEIVVSLRGSSSYTDFLTDASITLVTFTSPGVGAPSGTRVHVGFLGGWNSVADAAISAVRTQLASYPGYTIVTTGHSLGGALSSFAGIALKQNFPNSPVRLYNYGAPRVGNPTFATWVNSQIGVENVFRGIHTSDGVPTIIPTYLGYAHHATEYWQNPDPASASTTKKCDSSGEDLTCSTSRISGGINAAHLTYYGISLSTTFCS